MVEQLVNTASKHVLTTRVLNKARSICLHMFESLVQ